MPEDKYRGNQIRQTFIDFFVERGHTYVPSSSLVPGGDETLLFTNAGMVQFKDVFLGTDKRPYVRAANSQKCMRVAGKHNDLEDVGRDDTHHTFFEMLGNWSFGDYYKKEAIAWAWELLTEVWHLPKANLWATCFEDELGEIPRDDEAADHWRRQPGFDPDHVLFFGRKDNFWEMAETGPCGPNSEIHIDRGPAYCDKQDVPGHVCKVNGDCQRFLELWNLVFIQYNRLDEKTLELLPKKHVDTGMGFERIVAVLQDVDSNYKTDLLSPLIDRVQELTGHDADQVQANWTPYRVIADHGRAAAFLIADGVVPGNTGRNYVCRMIIRRAARFGGKIGLDEPFLAHVADVVVREYGEAYPELVRNRAAILETITQEERRFLRTLESGLAHLEQTLDELQARGQRTLPGRQAFDLYATFGLPLEISRDIAQERGLQVDEAGFQEAMRAHREVSGQRKGVETFTGKEAEVYQQVITELQAQGALGPEGVVYDPYTSLEVEGPVLALFVDGKPVPEAHPGDQVEVLLARTGFYLEAGGQVSDTGQIAGRDGGDWLIEVEDMRQPAAGAIVHVGRVVRGSVRRGDTALATVDRQRRLDIMRNHTATHLLHAELRAVLGEHARQAGSLVAPDRLRFDFTHAEALTPEQLARIEEGVNRHILANYRLQITFKPLQQAMDEGAMALFGEKYGQTVRTIAIGEPEAFSYELCGGTHLEETADIGIFLITSESSVAAGIRRIEAVTGRGAYRLVRQRFQALDRAADLLSAPPEKVPDRVAALLSNQNEAEREIARLRSRLTNLAFDQQMEKVPTIAGVPVMTARFPEADSDTLRQLADRFRQRFESGVAVLASVHNARPLVIAVVTDDLVARGLRADDLVRHVAAPLGGGGGGRPSLAQAGGKDASKLDETLASVGPWVEQKLQP